MTTARDLTNFAREALRDKQFVAAIQREPYMHVRTPNDSIRIQKTVGGGGVLLNGILRKVGGLMVATAAGDADADVVDSRSRIKIPPNEESYTLKRVFL